MATQQCYLAGRCFNCIKCGKFYGRVNKMDGSGEIDNADLTKEEYMARTNEMEESIKDSGKKLLTYFDEGITCNSCSKNN